MRQSAKSVPVRVATLAAVFALFAACGGSDSGEPTISTATATSEPAVGTDAPPGGIGQEELATYLENANDFVRDIIVDGVVTPAEYERAVTRTLQCLDDEGVPHSEPEFRGGSWTYDVGPSPDGELARHSEVHDQCDRDFLRTVATLWARQSAPSESDLIALEGEFVECLQEAGLEFSSRAESDIAMQQGLLTEDEAHSHFRCLLLVYTGEDIGERPE